MAATIALWRLFRLGLVERAEGGLRLTADGRERAVHLVRSHRLWEAYLVEYLGLPLDHVHGPAERMEHYIGEKLQQKIAKDLPQGAVDPHGREIPR
jgi:Mn-dependent DtxR family transcriptional regulator